MRPLSSGFATSPVEALSNLKRSTVIIFLEVDVTARSKELLCDGCKPFFGREVYGQTRSAQCQTNKRRKPFDAAHDTHTREFYSRTMLKP